MIVPVTEIGLLISSATEPEIETLLPEEASKPGKLRLLPLPEEVVKAVIGPVVPLCAVQPFAVARPVKLKDSKACANALRLRIVRIKSKPFFIKNILFGKSTILTLKMQQTQMNSLLIFIN